MELAKLINGNIELVYCDPNKFDVELQNAEHEYGQATNILADVLMAQELDIDLLKDAKQLVDDTKLAYEKLHEANLAIKKKYNDFISDGFLPFVAEQHPNIEEGKKVIDSFDVKDGKLVQRWELKDDKKYYQKQIDELKMKLASSDYKVIKCYEANLIGSSPPYDILLLNSERQAIRDNINMLEGILNNL